MKQDHRYQQENVPDAARRVRYEVLSQIFFISYQRELRPD